MMYRYRNRRTGVEFLSACECFGEDIEQMPSPEAAHGSAEGFDPSAGPTAGSSPSERAPKRTRRK